MAKPATDETMHASPLSIEILNTAELRINGARAHVSIDPWAVSADRMSAQFRHLYNITTEEMLPTSLFTAIKISISGMTKNGTIEVHK